MLVYKKGAWVLHMLRIMMLDFKTMDEDRFTGMMREFYGTYQGKRASTEDFRRWPRSTSASTSAGSSISGSMERKSRATAWPTGLTRPRTGQYRVKLQVEQQNVGEEFQMYVPVTLDLGNNQVARVRVKVRGPSPPSSFLSCRPSRNRSCSTIWTGCWRR